MNKTIVNIPSNINLNIYVVPVGTVLLQLLPMIFSSTTTFFSILVFAHPSMNDPTSRFLLAITVADFTYSFVTVPDILLLSYCGQMPLLCGSTTQFGVLIYDYIIAYGITSYCAMFSILGEIFLTIQRLFIILNKSWLKNWTVTYVGPVILAFCIVFYIPYWFILRVQDTGIVYYYKGQYYDSYRLLKTTFGNSYAGAVLLNFVSIVRIVLVLVIMSVLNMITIYVFRKYMNKKALLTKRILNGEMSTRKSITSRSNTLRSQSSVGRLTSEQIASRNVTLMFISTAFLYTAGNVVSRISFINSLLNFIQNAQAASIMTRVGTVFLYSFVGFKFFVFMSFNAAYRKQFLKYVTFLCPVAAKWTASANGSTHVGASQSGIKRPTRQSSNNNINK